MKFRFIRRHVGQYPVTVMCRVLGVSRSGYYAWRRRPESRRSREDRRLQAKIRTIHRKNHRVYGSPRIHRELRSQGIRCGRKRVARLMREAGLRARQKRRFKATTDSKHSHPVAANLLEQQFEVVKPDTVWLGDITYIWTREGWLYLAAVMDLASRRIVGWAMGNRITSDLTLNALNMAIRQRRPSPGLIHHTDRGSQYACKAYRTALDSHGIVASMSRRGNCYDNAPMESFFHSLKVELIYGRRFRTRGEAQSAIFRYIEVFYNRQRLHSSLGYQSPSRWEQRHAA